jgi:hypothetical protein
MPSAHPIKPPALPSILFVPFASNSFVIEPVEYEFLIDIVDLISASIIVMPS